MLNLIYFFQTGNYQCELTFVFVDFFQTRLPVYISHAPAGTSMQDMVHFAQVINKYQEISSSTCFKYYTSLQYISIFLSYQVYYNTCINILISYDIAIK